MSQRIFSNFLHVLGWKSHSTSPVPTAFPRQQRSKPGLCLVCDGLKYISGLQRLLSKWGQTVLKTQTPLDERARGCSQRVKSQRRARRPRTLCSRLWTMEGVYNPGRPQQSSSLCLSSVKIAGMNSHASSKRRITYNITSHFVNLKKKSIFKAGMVSHAFTPELGRQRQEDLS